MDVNFILKNNSLELNLLTASTKYIYNILILNKYVRPTALDKWQGIYCIEENDWSDIFKLCYFCWRETKLQVFNLKLCTQFYHAKNGYMNKRLLILHLAKCVKRRRWIIWVITLLNGVAWIIFWMYFKIGQIELQHILFN